MSENNEDWHCTIREAGNFNCSILDSNGCLHIMPEGKKMVLRYENKIVVVINPGERNEERRSFLFRKENGRTFGVEIDFSNRIAATKWSKWMGGRN